MAREGPQPRRRTVVRYHDAQGNRCRSTDPGAVRTAEQTRTYYVRTGKRWESLGTADLGEAWIRLRQKKHGKPAPPQQTLETHLQAFRDTLGHRGITAKHVGEIICHLQRIASLAGWRALSDMTPASLLSALAKLKEQGRSAQTRKHYFRHCFQFARWALPAANPFAGMNAPKTSTDRRHDRRCPTESELYALWAYLDSHGCKVRRSMDGRQRKMGYRVCLGTGFRAEELRVLTRESFDLAMATVALPAMADKRKKAVLQPIPPWLLDELRAYFAMGGQPWWQFPRYWPGRILRDDLVAAGVEYAVEGPDGPLFFDFHSLRIWYITELSHQPGISPKDLMTLARHSDPRLTMSVYAKSRTESARRVAEQVKRPGE